jgi:hypothetical protein
VTESNGSETPFTCRNSALMGAEIRLAVLPDWLVNVMLLRTMSNSES